MRHRLAKILDPLSGKPDAESSGRTVGVLLYHHSKQLEAVLNLDPGSARIEVQCLLQSVLQVNRARLLAHPEQSLNPEQYACFAALFERRLSGEPIAYLLGEREFFGLNFKVSPATLIPRPDTELLVELALQRIPPPFPPTPLPVPAWGISAASGSKAARTNETGESGGQAGRGKKLRVLDLGTGSGAVALSIAHARLDAEVTAVDASQDALEVAQLNAQRLNLDNVRLLQGDWFSALGAECFDLIVSNPPYIAAGDAHLSQGDLRFEPHAALVSGADGLDDMRRIVAQARVHLNVGGWLLLEHSYDQAARVRALLQQAEFIEVFSACDLSGTERVSCGLAS